MGEKNTEAENVIRNSDFELNFEVFYKSLVRNGEPKIRVEFKTKTKKLSVFLCLNIILLFIHLLQIQFIKRFLAEKLFLLIDYGK